MKITSTNCSNTKIDTIKVTYDDSIYNKNNYGHDQQYYNEYDYFGSGNKKNSNQIPSKKNIKKQKSKNNANEINDYYGYNYQNDEGYEYNYQNSSKNYYNITGANNKQQKYKSNSNNNFEY